MNFKIIIGPANSGKSQRLCREMVKAAKTAPDENFIAIVPEQFTLQMQRRVVEISENHAVMNIDIVSFNRLALKVFNELGINLNEILDDTGKSLILRKVLDENAKDLVLYRKKVHMTGFIDEMKSVITELGTYGVSEEALAAAFEFSKDKNPALAGKLKDIGLIYHKFNEEIKDIYTTSEEVPDLFARALYRSDLIKGTHIYLDGFTGFTPVQYRIIEGFLTVCADVAVTITAPADAIGGSSSESSLFYMAGETYSRLLDIASKAQIKAETAFYDPVSDDEAENDLVNGAAGNKAEIFEYEAAVPEDEVFFTASEITRLVQKEGFRYREIAVVTTDMDGYYPYLEKSFRQFGIPAFIDHKAGITNNRLAKYVLAALRIVKERFSYDSIFSYLKCGLADLSMDEVCRLENYCLEFGIKGPVIWSREFTKNRTLRGREEKAWDLEEINALRVKVMESVSGFAARAKRAKTALEYKEAFDKLFEANNTQERILALSDELAAAGKEREAEEYAQIFGIITDLFEKAKVLTKQTQITLDDYINMIRNGILEIKIGLIPPTLDMVTAGDLERSRFNKIKALFILGANEGSLPKSSSGRGILSEKDRAFLKEADLTLAPCAMENFYTQRYYLYLMLNKPKKYLYLCHAASGADGETLSRSGIFDDLDEYIPGAGKRLSKTENRGGNFCEEKGGTGVLAGQIGKFAENPDEDSIDRALLGYAYKKDPKKISRIIESAFYTNAESPLDEETAGILYGENLKGSVSRFESFNECAFRHFLSYGLGLEERPEYEIKADSLGTVYHSALEKYVNSVMEKGISLKDIDDEQSRNMAAAAAREAIAQEESHVFESSARNLYQAYRTVNVIVKTTDIIREKIKEGRYEIKEAETRFFRTLSDGSTFTGIIDRIDVMEEGDDIYVNIIDYKTGSKKFSLKETAAGVQLQLPVYLRSALERLKAQNPGKNIHPSGIYYFLVRDEFEKEEDKEKEDAHLKGLSESEERMEALMDFTQEKLIETGRRIKSGEVSPSPLKESGSMPCDFCDFKSICRFKEGSFGASSRQMRDLSRAQLEEEIYGSD